MATGSSWRTGGGGLRGDQGSPGPHAGTQLQLLGHGLWGRPSSHQPRVGPGSAAESAGAQVEPRWREEAWSSPCPASLLRIFIIWAISSWFRRGPAPQDQAGPGGAPRVASRNLFPKDTLMVTASWEGGPWRGGRGGGHRAVTGAIGTHPGPSPWRVCEQVWG